MDGVWNPGIPPRARGRIRRAHSSSGPARKTCLNEVSHCRAGSSQSSGRQSSWKGHPMRAPLRVVAWMLLLLVGLTAPDVAPLADDVGSHDQPTALPRSDSAPRRATSSGSTIARSHATAAVPNRGRPNVAMARARRRSTQQAVQAQGAQLATATPRLVRRCCRCAIIFMT